MAVSDPRGPSGRLNGDTMTDLTEAYRDVKDDLVLLAAPEADRVRELLGAAVEDSDAEAIRREGHLWSGRIGLQLLRLADLVEANRNELTLRRRG